MTTEVVTNNTELQAALDGTAEVILVDADIVVDDNIVVDRSVIIDGQSHELDAALTVEGGAEVSLYDMVFAPTTALSNLSSSIENIVIGVRDGKLIADGLTVNKEQSLYKVNLVGIVVQGVSELELTNSEFNLVDGDYSLVYGVYVQPGGTVTISNNNFNLSNLRRTLAVGVELNGSTNENVDLTGNVLAVNTGYDQYNVQVYNGGTAIDETTLHAWVDTLLESGQTSYIYNGTSFYLYPDA